MQFKWVRFKSIVVCQIFGEEKLNFGISINQSKNKRKKLIYVHSIYNNNRNNNYKHNKINK